MESKYQTDLKNLNDNIQALMENILAKLNVENSKESFILKAMENLRNNVTSATINYSEF